MAQAVEARDHQNAREDERHAKDETAVEDAHKYQMGSGQSTDQAGVAHAGQQRRQQCADLHPDLHLGRRAANSKGRQTRDRNAHPGNGQDDHGELDMAAGAGSHLTAFMR